MHNKQIKTDLTKLEPIDKLSSDELALHCAMQEGKFILHNDAKTLAQYAEIFKNSAKGRLGV